MKHDTFDKYPADSLELPTRPEWTQRPKGRARHPLLGDELPRRDGGSSSRLSRGTTNRQSGRHQCFEVP